MLPLAVAHGEKPMGGRLASEMPRAGGSGRFRHVQQRARAVVWPWCRHRGASHGNCNTGRLRHYWPCRRLHGFTRTMAVRYCTYGACALAGRGPGLRLGGSGGAGSDSVSRAAHVHACRRPPSSSIPWPLQLELAPHATRARRCSSPWGGPQRPCRCPVYSRVRPRWPTTPPSSASWRSVPSPSPSPAAGRHWQLSPAGLAQRAWRSNGTGKRYV